MSTPSHPVPIDVSHTRNLHHVRNGTDGIFIATMVGLGLVILFMVAVLVISTCGDRNAARRERIVQTVSRRRRRRRAPKKTGLAALSDSERHAVLERLFAGMPYGKINASPTHDGDMEKQKNENTQNNESSGDDDTVSSETSSTGDFQSSNQQVTVAIPTGEAAEEQDSFENDDCCVICLTEYTQGEMVLSGRSCRHRFHRECVIEWLEKHDDCPFCRKEMMTSTEFREAAIETLGQERIEQLGETETGASNEDSHHETNTANTATSDASTNDTPAGQPYESTSTSTPPERLPQPTRYYDY